MAAITEHEAKEGWVGAHTKVIEQYLESKGADTPCHRCGNKRFLVPEHNHGPFFVAYCSKCGHKNEYLIDLLLTTDEEE